VSRYEARLRASIGAVIREALEARGARGVVVLDDGGPEARLVARWLRESLGDHQIRTLSVADPAVEPLLHAVHATGAPVIEVLRFRARLVHDALIAHPANKTALLLGGALPPDPLLPLGDVWASEVAGIAGSCSLPPAVEQLARDAGGVRVLDDALRDWLQGRDPDALDGLPAPVASAVRERFAAGRADRLHPRVVPKLTVRTLGVDLFE
jgi:hypothetical protein